MNFKLLLKNWLPAVIWLGVIFLGSTDLMSAEHTSRFIVPFLRWLKPDISPETLASIHFIVRKCAHLGEYAVLALLLLHAAIFLTNLKRSLAILLLRLTDEQVKIVTRVIRAWSRRWWPITIQQRTFRSWSTAK